jgi:hypothetical protein
MKRHLAVTFLLVAAGCAAFGLRAETVGRTDIALPGAQWTLLTSYTTKMTFDKGRGMEQSLPLHTKVFQLPADDGTIKALLVVTSSGSGSRMASVTWVSETCPQPRNGYFTQDYRSNQHGNTRECLIINSSFGPFSYFKPDSEVLKAIEASGLTLFKSGYSLRTQYGAKGGTLLRVNLVTRKDFKGLPAATPAARDTHGVPPALVAWGESLHKRVKGSVLSISGELALPPVEFDGQAKVVQ